MSTVRAANVSARLRRAGYSVLRSSGRMDRGADGIRVRQSGQDATVSIWASRAGELAEELREVLASSYRVSKFPTTDIHHAMLRVSPKGD